MLFDVEPEQFDILGILAFSLVTVCAVIGLLRGGQLPRWSLVLLLLVGLGGLVIDLLIVSTVVL